MLYARRKGWALEGAEVLVRRERADGAGTERIAVRLTLGGDITPEQEARLRAVSRRCPVHRMLAGQVEIVEH